MTDGELTGQTPERSIGARDATRKESDLKRQLKPNEVVEKVVLRGNRIKQLLDESDPPVTQLGGAKRAGLSYRHFNRIVLNDCDPSLLIAFQVAASMGRPLEELFDVEVKTKMLVPKQPRRKANGNGNGNGRGTSRARH